MNQERRVNMVNTVRGISLIEVMVIILAIGLLVGLAMQSMTGLLKDARVVETEREMDALANAIVGNAAIMSVAGGIRSDFGYVGDIGALPDSLGALASNPGFGTWNGPYIPSELNQPSRDFRRDAWGVNYTYTGGVSITSTGSGESIVKSFAENSSDLLSNTVGGIIRDANDSLPSTDDTANISVVIIYPDGLGGLDTSATHPDDSGWFSVSSVPIGRHPLMVIYTPEVDTLFRYVSVMPRHSNADLVHFNFDSAYFSTIPEEYVGLTPVAGSDTAYGAAGACNNLKFWIENTTDATIQVSSITLSYTKTAFYSALDWGGDEDYEFENPSTRNASGTVVNFSPAKSVASGASRLIVVEIFKTTQTGSGSVASMANETVTVSLSDGSNFDITFDYCE